MDQNAAGSSLRGERRPSLTRVEWLICIIASIGFAFDIYELLMLPLTVGPALRELLGTTDRAVIESWVGWMFFAPAFAGGIFGLLGGYLTDLFGRRRVLTWSILLYAFSALAAGFSTSAEMLLFFRCTTFIGVCVEFVAAIAWLAELFDDPKQREAVLGYTQAFSSVGGLLVGVAWLAITAWGESLPAIYGEHSSWRYMFISGVIPALPLIIIRPVLPESPKWAAKKAAGTLKRPSPLELFRPAFAKTTIVTTIMFACSYGAAFGAIQHIPRIIPGLPEVQLEGGKQDPEKIDRYKGVVHLSQEIGGLMGRFALAILVTRIVSRRWLLRLFQIPGLLIVPLVFLFPAQNNYELLIVGMFLAGFFTVAQFSFWGNYLPRVYPLHLRGTGESFAANIGGRMLGTSAALVTTSVAASGFWDGYLPDGLSPPLETAKALAYTAAGMAFLVYFVGLVASFWLPEPEAELPE